MEQITAKALDVVVFPIVVFLVADIALLFANDLD